MNKCPKCGCEIQDSATVCPECGDELEKTKRKKWVIGIIVAVVCVALVLLCANYNSIKQLLCKHDFSPTGNVVKIATCQETGIEMYKCKLCNKEEEHTLPVVECVYDEKVITQPSCTENGEKILTCKWCKTQKKETIKNLGHDYKKKVVKKPTCTEKGTDKYTCSRCGHSYNKATNALGHSWVDATCTAPKKCSVCGKTEGKALGHTVESGKCGRCGEEIHLSKQQVNKIVQVGKTQVLHPYGSDFADIEIVWANTSDKAIKYIYFLVTGYDSVGEKFISKYSSQLSNPSRLHATGPYYKKTNFSRDDLYSTVDGWEKTRWDNVWLYSAATYATINEIRIEYMDGTSAYIDGEKDGLSYIAGSYGGYGDWQIN